MRLALIFAIALTGCIEYEPTSSLPELGVPNPRELEGSHQVIANRYLEVAVANFAGGVLGAKTVDLGGGRLAQPQ